MYKTTSTRNFHPNDAARTIRRLGAKPIINIEMPRGGLQLLTSRQAQMKLRLLETAAMRKTEQVAPLAKSSTIVKPAAVQEIKRGEIPEGAWQPGVEYTQQRKMKDVHGIINEVRNYLDWLLKPAKELSVSVVCHVGTTTFNHPKGGLEARKTRYNKLKQMVQPKFDYTYHLYIDKQTYFGGTAAGAKPVAGMTKEINRLIRSNMPANKQLVEVKVKKEAPAQAKDGKADMIARLALEIRSALGK